MSGLLNIAKCLHDAIHRLEKKAAKAEEQGGMSDQKQELAASLLKVSTVFHTRYHPSPWYFFRARFLCGKNSFSPEQAVVGIISSRAFRKRIV